MNRLDFMRRLPAILVLPSICETLGVGKPATNHPAELSYGNLDDFLRAATKWQPGSGYTLYVTTTDGTTAQRFEFGEFH